MTIGIPTDFTVVSTDISDSTPLYSSNGEYAKYEWDKVRHDGKVYLATQNIITKTWDPAATEYKVGDLFWGISVFGFSATNQVVKAMEGETRKQPSQYDNVDTSADHTTWQYRFVKVRFEPYTFEFNDLQYTFIPNGDTIHVEIVSLPPNTGVSSIYDLPRISLLTSIHAEDEAEIYNNPDTGDDYWIPKFAYEDDTGIYIRTNVSNTNAPVEMIYTSDVPIFDNAVSPADIPGFTYLEATDDMKPFDKYNYSNAEKSGSMTLKISPSSNFNMFGLYVMGSTFDYTVKDSGGSTVANDSGIPIDGRTDVGGVLPDYFTTIPVYLPSVVGAGGTIELTVHGSPAKLGSFKPYISADQGWTNLQISNTTKDFSAFEYDPFGNVDYIDKARVGVYSGTVDVPIERYDITDRFMLSLGKKLVFIDGSDNTSNAAVDSKDIFAATQKIGRIMTHKQNTKVKYGDISPIASYTFSIEETT